MQFLPRSVVEYVYPAAWQKHNTQSSFYSVTYSIFSSMIKLTHKYYTFNARKPWFIQPVEYLFIHFLGTQSLHYRVLNNEKHCIYLTCTINRSGSFHELLCYSVQGRRRNFVRSTVLEMVWVYMRKSSPIARCKGQKWRLYLQLAQCLARPRRISNKHTHHGLACIQFITRLCS